MAGRDEWYTPPSIFEALGLRYDLDPCSPAGGVPWAPVERYYSLPDENGLWLPWAGRVWLNPPYGRDGPVFVERLAAHGNGIALVAGRTDTRWWQAAAGSADLILFVAGRIAFVPGPEIVPGDRAQQYASFGSTLLAWGAECAAAVRQSGLGVPMVRIDA